MEVISKTYLRPNNCLPLWPAQTQTPTLSLHTNTPRLPPQLVARIVKQYIAVGCPTPLNLTDSARSNILSKLNLPRCVCVRVSLSLSLHAVGGHGDDL